MQTILAGGRAIRATPGHFHDPSHWAKIPIAQTISVVSEIADFINNPVLFARIGDATKVPIESQPPDERMISALVASADRFEEAVRTGHHLMAAIAARSILRGGIKTPVARTNRQPLQRSRSTVPAFHGRESDRRTRGPH